MYVNARISSTWDSDIFLEQQRMEVVQIKLRSTLSTHFIPSDNFKRKLVKSRTIIELKHFKMVNVNSFSNQHWQQNSFSFAKRVTIFYELRHSF